MRIDTPSTVTYSCSPTRSIRSRPTISIRRICSSGNANCSCGPFSNSSTRCAWAAFRGVLAVRRRRHRRLEAQPGVLDDPRHVGDQRDAAVSHDRRAGEDADPLDRGVHRLDDDLLRAAHLIHDQPEAAAGRPQDQDVRDPPAGRRSPRARPGSPPWSPP